MSDEISQNFIYLVYLLDQRGKVLLSGRTENETIKAFFKYKIKKKLETTDKSYVIAIYGIEFNFERNFKYFSI